LETAKLGYHFFSWKKVIFNSCFLKKFGAFFVFKHIAGVSLGPITISPLSEIVIFALSRWTWWSSFLRASRNHVAIVIFQPIFELLPMKRFNTFISFKRNVINKAHENTYYYDFYSNNAQRFTPGPGILSAGLSKSCIIFPNQSLSIDAFASL